METKTFIDMNEISADSNPSLVWELITTRAVTNRVSDIHLLAQKENYELCFRIDGDMFCQGSVDRKFARQLISHVKAAAGMDVGESRRPIEGHIRQEIEDTDRKVDLRISTIPSIHGQDMVVRIFDRNMSLLDVEDLGLQNDQLEQIKDILVRPQGLVLVTGASGSGKTTSLYAMLRKLSGKTRKIITIEDPVEFDLDNVNQTQVNHRIGVNFASMLSAIMRQDPDIIMVGEIRDHDTAVTAIRAANTGHLVFATTHAPRATRAIEVMLSLGVHPYFLASSLRAVVSQVLVKQICPHCKIELQETVDILVEPIIQKHIPAGHKPMLSIGTGCEHCHQTGYLGRTALFDIFVPDDEARQNLINNKSVVSIQDTYNKHGMLTLEQAGKLAALTGQTTMEELVRVLPSL